MSRTCQLIMVTGENNNKFYNMEEEGGSIHVTYGRIGCKETHKTYPLYEWDTIKAQKLRKGYQEVTSLKCETKATSFSLDNKQIESLVKTLVNKARNSISDNYMVSYKDVTQAQIDEAQSVLDSILEYRKRKMMLSEINDKLCRLYTVVPRKMKNTREHLLQDSDIYKYDTDGTKHFDSTRIKEIISEEQALLDTMATQVQQNNTSNDEEQKNILEVAGLEMMEISSEEEQIIKNKLGNNSHQFVRAFKVVNKNTQEKFNKCLEDSKNHKTELLWHGSRTENWWSILSTGLMIRPSGVVTTGSMFGNAIYFATKAQKSIGYTSLNNSYWASGSDSKAYLALFEVHVGEQKHIYEHTSSCYDLNYNKINKDGYDSVFAHAGKSLRNDELMIYKSEQCTVKYIVEISQ